MDRLIAIYPTARKVEEVLKQQSRVASRLNHKVLTFPQLIDGLYRDCPDRHPVLGPLAERLALEEALQQTARAGHSSFSLSVGLIDHLLGLIREFKGAAVQPGDLHHASGALSQAAAVRVSSLAAVFSTYQVLLERRGLDDRHDREQKVLSMLERAEAGGQRPRTLDGVAHLLVAEIYDFTLLQFRIVTSLIRLIGDATVTIQAEPHRVDAFRFPDLTWNRFVEDESIAEQTLPLFVRREGRPGQLGYVLRNLFEGIREEPPPFDDTVTIVDAPDRYREVEEVARAIRRALEAPASEQIEPRRIALVARDLTPYAEYLESVFRRFRIPLNLSVGRAPIGPGAASLILDMLHLPIAGYRRQTLDRLLKSAQISIPAARYRSLLNQSGYIDATTRGLATCLEDYRLRLTAEVEAASEAAVRDAAEARLARLTRGTGRLLELIEVLEQLERPGTVAEHVERLGEVLEQLKFEPLASSAAGDPKQRGIQYPAWGAMSELADAARLVAAERSLSLAEFADLASEVLSQPRAEGPSVQPAQAVQAFPVLEARGLDFDLVFLMGLEDGGFPHYRSEDPILPDELRIQLNRPLAARLQSRLGRDTPAAVRKILRTTNERNSEDRFLFFLALSMPERRIVLSYPRFDKQGNPYASSPFLQEVSRLLRIPGPQPRRSASERLIAGLEDCFDQGSLLNWAADRSILNLPQAGVIADRSQLGSIARRIEVERRRERYLALPTREQQASAQSHPDRLGLVDLYSGRVEASSRLRAFLLGPPGSPKPWSPSRLDQLAACGFKYFAARVLRLEQEDEIDYEPSALEVGGLMHAVAHELFLLPIDYRDRSRALAQARKFLDDYRPKARAGAMARETALFDLRWQDVERVVEELIALACDEFELHAFSEPPLLEQGFEFPLRDWRPAKDGEPLELVLHGRLDRLDFNRNREGLVDRIRVRDYKSSRSIRAYFDMLKPEAFGVTTFQLPVYLMAALDRFRSEAAPGLSLEADYLVLRHRDKCQQTAVTVAQIETEAESRAALARTGKPSLADNIIALARSAVRGEFDVDPRRCDEFCPYRRLCRYQKAMPLK